MSYPEDRFRFRWPNHVLPNVQHMLVRAFVPRDRSLCKLNLPDLGDGVMVQVGVQDDNAPAQRHCLVNVGYH